MEQWDSRARIDPAGSGKTVRRACPEAWGWEPPAPTDGEKREAAGKHPAMFEPLQYPALCGEQAEAEATEAEAGEALESGVEARLAARDAEWQVRCEAVRSEAAVQARSQAEEERMALLHRCAEQWEQAVRNFERAREGYFARVEREVVELALAIAARILQREAQLDPLLLTGAVRVALGQLAESTQVELRVPVDAHQMWSETLRLMPGLTVTPAVVADSEIQEGECLLVTELGRVDLGVRAQLKEIERGFFDLLSQRDSMAGRTPAGTGV